MDSTVSHNDTDTDREVQTSPYISPGMPTLDMSGKPTSFYEFWPAWVMYFPVVVQSLILAIRYRSLTLPLIANPRLPLSGMAGVEKSLLMVQAQGECESAILSWFLYQRTEADLDDQVTEVERQLVERGFNLPIVCKPDIGCCGVGVRLVRDRAQLRYALSHYPVGAGMLLQVLASWEPEAGVFYVRQPEEEQGKIISMAMKYTPYVVGDGESTLRQLIESDSRAGELKHLYLQRHQPFLSTVIDNNEPYRLVFAASHTWGAIFKDARQHITPELSARIDSLMKDLPEFYYGRLDIKFRDLESFKRGENIEIVEINSASSESLHIWDKNTSFSEAIRSLLFQYRTLFTLGAQNRTRGYCPPRLSALLAGWKRERELTRLYPETD